MNLPWRMMSISAEVVRFESQLTVPTRDRAHLSDLWIAVFCRSGFGSWAAEFGRIVLAKESAGTSAGALQVVAMSAHQGWVVARGVDLRIHDVDEVEARVRKVVARVNLGAPASPHGESPLLSASRRSRFDAPAMEGTSAWRRMFSPRPASAVDALSGS
jgi:hypothetical protein